MRTQRIFSGVAATSNDEDQKAEATKGKGWSWGGIVAAAAAAAAVGAVGTAAYVKREIISNGITELLEHLEFVSVLVLDEDLRKR